MEKTKQELEFEKMAEAIITPDFIDNLVYLGFGMYSIGLILFIISRKLYGEWIFLFGVIILLLCYFIGKNFKIIEVNPNG